MTKWQSILRSHGLSISSPTTIKKWKEKYIFPEEQAPSNPPSSPFTASDIDVSVPNYNWGIGWSYPGVS